MSVLNLKCMRIFALKTGQVGGIIALILSGCTHNSDRILQAASPSPRADSAALLAKINGQRLAVLPYLYKNAEKTNLCEGELDK
jgi:hypothetical protein